MKVVEIVGFVVWYVFLVRLNINVTVIFLGEINYRVLELEIFGGFTWEGN